MVKINALAAFGLLSLASQAMALATIKVMPLGASIVTRCWRANLQAKLRNNGVTNFDFVGSQRSTTCTGIVGDDQDHEGHPGSLVTDYAKNGNVTGWLNQNPPDVVVFFMGHNDIIIGKKTDTEILGAYDVMLDQIRAKNPKMQIVFSSLTPLDPARWTQETADRVKGLAIKVAAYAPTKSTAISPVYFVDNFDGYNAATDTEDGLHPNSVGNEKMASKFIKNTQLAIQAATKTKAGKRLSRWERTLSLVQ
ncbi:carbohydrate esterase family 3 protein [Dothidotthia symphoricarpi CBS 119687]|uniref:Carbohydrate esterase family 3 protein n=1 Tax=Dothidotthia symphoricarpi CBS 119687 TaxID=1392245 RepID=A0A6A6AET5_9PLEO|nr:carbohydrate esterase family 3 protein [Dothidotthia symphoricarpi CBS 119687]KAF2129528.1 carbohydrate esterase family 3 protein [Dothidotthia symphoricarpi CBS 119687]